MAESSQSPRSDGDPEANQTRLLATLQQLLAIDATELKPALDQASDLLIPALSSDKIDTFFYDSETDSLVAIGTSRTAMGHKQKALGLDRLPVSNFGRTVGVFRTGKSFISGRVQEDREVLKGIREGLGVRSMIAVPLLVAGELRGVLAACSGEDDHYTDDDLQFLEAVSNWVGAVAHRTELAERVRQHAVDEARRVTAEQLITVLAHDLGNRLTPAIGRIDMIRRTARREGNEQYLRAADSARKALEQLNDMIQDLLDVSRLERGLFSLTFSNFDLVAVTREVVEGLKAGGANIDFHSVEPVTLDGDEARVRQAIENLVTNAVKHGPNGVPVHVEVETEHSQNGESAIVAISDEGPGIEPELLPRLFTAFSAGSQSTGLGIGLFLAYRIAGAHGGSLKVDSTLGSGTTFYLRLPLASPG